MTESKGSVRVDLLGGTIDLSPINLILKDVVTLNLATNLKAKIKIENTKENHVQFISKDYDNELIVSESDFVNNKISAEATGAFEFVVRIVALFKTYKNLKITLESGSPPGSGLGGSSAMGVTLYKGMLEHLEKYEAADSIITKVQAVESQILNKGPAGYQDYYPALFGGILALKASVGGIEVEQLYNDDLKNFLEKSLILVDSKEQRLSGINNWEVYKQFFDKDPDTIKGLEEIALLASDALKAIKNKNFEQLLELIKKEGEVRTKLFPGIMTDKISKLFKKIKKLSPESGIKACGAGGGGCFLILCPDTGDDLLEVKDMITAAGMKILPFKVNRPL